MSTYANALRQELTARALAIAEQHKIAYECSTNASSAVIFRADEDGGVHGNFFPASYRRGLGRPEWRRRLRKAHTSARRCLASHDCQRSELDTAASSDALLMNVFCHPGALAPTRRSGLRALLGTVPPERLEFGYKPRIPLRNGHVERTEVDLRIGALLIEAKLTETDFQTAPLKRVINYRDAEEVFDLAALPMRNGLLLHYQLIRGVLAAFAGGGRYCVIVDARRPDLVDAFATVIRAVCSYELRTRLQVATWQEIAVTLPTPMRIWLATKYGILAA